jgi:inner membrane protein
MGRAGFNRKTELATLTMVLAAEAADCDVLWELKGRIQALQYHRGITHSFVGVPFMAAATLGFVYLLYRFWLRHSKPRPGYPPVRWKYLYWLALLAALSHVLLDYTTAYGIRLFEPFDYRWYSWDIIFIFEPLMFGALVLGLVVPSLFGLVNQEIGARNKGPGGRGGAILALVCVLVIWGYRDFQHRRALNAMSALTYNGEAATKIAAYPYMINPFHWYGVLETRDFFQTFGVDSGTPKVDPEGRVRIFYKPEETPVTLAAKQAYFGRVYLDWAVFPLAESERVQNEFHSGYAVEFQDLRYAYPGRTVLGGFVLLDPSLHVVAQAMNNKRPVWLRRVDLR